MKLSILLSLFASIVQTATAAVVRDGTVIPTACAEQVHTQVKMGATGVILASSLCRARIEGDNKAYYTVDADVWEVLHNKISPPQVALVGKIAVDNMIVWNSNTRITIGSVEDDQTEIRLYDGKRTIIGENVR